MRKSILMKFVLLLLTAAMLLSLFACDNTPNETTEPETDVTTEVPTQSETESEAPTESEKPTESETPVETETPTESETPVETETPTESETPVETETPTESETPSETETPTESETPSETETPTESETPSETEAPTESETEEPVELLVSWDVAALEKRKSAFGVFDSYAIEETYVSFRGTKGSPEAYFGLFDSSSVGVTGNYFIIKYRYPESNVSFNPKTFQLYCATGAAGAGSAGFSYYPPVTADGQWHVAILDLAGLDSKFAKGADGTYTAQFMRLDILDAKVAATDGIDIALIAMHDDLDEAIKFFVGDDAVSIDVKLNNTSEGTMQYDPATGDKVYVPGMNIGTDPTQPKYQYDFYVKGSGNASTIKKAGSNGAAMVDGIMIGVDGKVTISDGWIICEGGTEAYVYSLDGGQTWIAFSGGTPVDVFLDLTRTAAGGKHYSRYDIWDGAIRSKLSAIPVELPANSKGEAARIEYLADKTNLDIFGNEANLALSNAYGQKAIVSGISFTLDADIVEANHSKSIDIIIGALYDYGATDEASDDKVVQIAYLNDAFFVHDGASGYTDNGNGTHSVYCSICNTAYVTEAHCEGDLTYDAENKTYTYDCAKCELEAYTTRKYNFFWDAEALNALPVNSVVSKLYNYSDGVISFTVTDGKDNTSLTGQEAYITLLKNNVAITGNYLVMKYKTTAGGAIDVFGGTVNNANNYLLSKTIVTDGEWAYVIIDLADGTDGFAAEEDGTYVADSLRVDLLNDVAENSVITVEFIAICDNLDNIQANLGDAIEGDACPHFVAADNDDCTPENAGEIENNLHTAACALCGENVTVPCSEDVANYVYDTEAETYYTYCPKCGDVYADKGQFTMFWDAEDLKAVGAGGGTVELSDDKTYVTYTQSATETYTNWLINDAFRINDTGRYLVIKYRLNFTGGTDLQVFANTKDSSYHDSTYHYNTFHRHDGWNVIVIDLTKLASGGDNSWIVADANGQYALKLLRVDVLGDVKDGTDTVDYAFIALCDDLAVVSDYLKATEDNATTEDVREDQNVCAHNFLGAATKIEDDYKNHEATCTICGKTMEFAHEWAKYSEGATGITWKCECDMSSLQAIDSSKASLVFDAATLYSKTWTHTTKSFIVENGEAFIRITEGTATDVRVNIYSPKGDPDRVETGKYLVIKYRVGAGIEATGSNGAIGIWTGTSDAYTQPGTDGNGGTDHNPAYVNDGEWRIIVLDLSTSKGDYFERTEGSGEYYANVLWLDPWGQSKLGTGNGTMDIAYIAYAKTLADIDAFMVGNETDLHDHKFAVTKLENDVVVGEGDDAVTYDVATYHSSKCYICGAISYERHIYTKSEETANGLVWTCECSNTLTQPVVNVGDSAAGWFINAYDLYIGKASDKITGDHLGGPKMSIDFDGDDVYATFGLKDNTSDSVFTNYISDADAGKYTGRYLVIKYRVTNYTGATTGSLHVWASTTATGAGAAGNKAYATAHNGQWNLIVIDLIEQASFDAGDTIKILRVDERGWGNTTSLDLDVAYMAIYDTLEEVSASIPTDEKTAIGENHNCVSDGAVSNGDGTHQTVCYICGKVNKNYCTVESSVETEDGFLKTCSLCKDKDDNTKKGTFITPINMFYEGDMVYSHLGAMFQTTPHDTEYTYTEGEGEGAVSFPYARFDLKDHWYKNIESSTDHAYFGLYMYDNSIEATGQYFIIKYRLTENITDTATFSLFTRTDGTSDAGNIKDATALNDDGYWYVAVIDLSKSANYTRKDPADATTEYFAKLVRIDLYNITPLSTLDQRKGENSADFLRDDAYFDIAYYGFSDSIEDLQALLDTEKTATKQHMLQEYVYVQNDTDTSDALYEQAVCKFCGEKYGPMRPAFFVYHHDGNATVPNFRAIGTQTTIELPENGTEITTIRARSWMGAKELITGYSYRITDKNGKYYSKDGSEITANGGWVDVSKTYTPYAKFAADGTTVQAVWSAVNTEAMKYGSPGYLTDQITAVYSGIDDISFANFDVNDLTLELKLLLDTDDESITDNALYVLKVTNIDCCAHTMEGAPTEGAEWKTHDGTCSKCGETAEATAHTWTVAYNEDEGGYVYSCTGCTQKSVQQTNNSIDLFLDANTLFNRSTAYNPQLTVDGNGAFVTITDYAGDSSFTAYSNGTQVTGQYFVLKYRFNVEDDVADPKYGQFWSSTVYGGPTYKADKDNDGVEDETTYTVTNMMLEYIADGDWHVMVIDVAFYDNSFNASGTGIGKNLFTKDGSGNYIAKFLRLDPLEELDANGGAKMDIAYAGFCSDLSAAVGLDDDYEYWGLEGEELRATLEAGFAGSSATLSDTADETIGMKYVTYTATVNASGEAYPSLTSSSARIANVGSVIAVLYKKPTEAGYITVWKNSMGTSHPYWNGTETVSGSASTTPWNFATGTASGVTSKSTEWDVVYFNFTDKAQDNPTMAGWMRADLFKGYTANTEQTIYVGAIKSFGSLEEAQAWAATVLP